MNLNEIFLKDVTRSIEGVVKADDSDHVGVEVEEYVFTNDAAKGVAPLLEQYTNYTIANGVWISGFFGSGKSHLLKMLAHLLGDVENQVFPRQNVSESFLGKTDDELLTASLKKAAAIPAKSLLFNIDQKATLIAKDQTDALLKVFVKVFDESRGYFGNDGAVARFEEDLDKRGQYEAFKDAFIGHSGIDWSQGREQTALEAHNIDEAFKEVNGQANPGIMTHYQKSYAVSIEDFAASVKAWIDEQEPGYRLNFFVDEVGQFIADDVKLMLNLQTIAESLNTKCKGQSWVFVTSQEDMDKVVGDRTKQQGNDFSKIQARFSARVKLTSQDVEEVISKRLLEKNDAGAAALGSIYSQEAANFPTIFNFVEGAKTYRNYIDKDRFINAYPFVTYQIPLFQAAIEGLSDHNMFEGKNSSVGERSMLGVVQEVAKRIGVEQVGYLATFDQMFAGIGAALKAASQSAILQAEKHLPDPGSEVTVLANRLLKALLLVKYVDSFKATPRNLTVLVYDRFGLDLTRLNKHVQEALNLLEAQSYVQRNGNIYEYLTNEEQEIEKEIKAVDVDSSEVSSKLFRYLSSDILRANRFKYAKNGQDFSFGYKLDDIVQGNQRELTIHFITPETSYTDSEITAHSMGRDELRVFLGRDKRLLADVRLLLKTEKYTKQSTNSGATPSMQAILQSKQVLNADREKELIERLRQAVGKAQLIINASEVISSSQDAVTRVTDGFQELVSRTYTSLGLLGGLMFPEQQVASAVQNDKGLFDAATISALNSPGIEMESWIITQTGLGEQVTIKKITDRFEAKSYGWDLGSIEVVLGWLVGTGKVALTVGSNPVARTEVAALIRNTGKHQYVVVAPQKAFDQAKVAAFKKFCTDFFDEAAVPSDPGELARFGKDKLASKRDELNALVDSSRYTFVTQLSGVLALLDEVVGKQVDWYLSNFDKADELLEAKDDLVDPIKSFLKGQQARIFDDAQALLNANAGNLGFLPTGSANSVEGLLGDENAFRGNKINQLKLAADKLRTQIDDVVRDKRADVTRAIEERKAEVLGSTYYAGATPAARESVIGRTDAILARLGQETQAALILQAGATFEEHDYPELLSQLVESQQGGCEDTPKPQPMVSVKTISAHGVTGVLESESDDFVLWMFSRAIEDFASITPDEYRNIRSDFNALRYDVRTQDVMTSLASRAAEALDVQSKVEHRDYRELVKISIFEEIDRKVIVDLAAAVTTQAVTPREVADIVRQRQHSLWSAKYLKLYEAIQSASELFAAIAALPHDIASALVGLDRYQSDWYRIDQHYRWFTYAYQTADFLKPLEALKAEVDRQYANKYLYDFGGLWQQALEPTSDWRFAALAPQAKFFDRHVAPVIKDGRTKVVVIISDGMRYEIAEELASIIRNENRFDASLSAVLGSLPSYTQLGMASLLPQSSLELHPEGLPVLADGKPTNGTANRDKVLQAVKGHAITAAAVLTMPGGELRELYTKHQVFYVYHDRIDAAGDKASTERTVFEAAEETLRELLQLVKKWTNANATNILITADHGFLYQDISLGQAYYVSEAPQGDAVTKANRRYVLGRSLKPSPSFMKFTSAQAGLAGDIDIQIPKSIHRIPQPGAGTRYVHGGASLQEIVVPVITVNKKRKSDIRPVNVELMPETDKITTGQLAVKLLQREAVTDKIQPRQVRLSLHVGDTLISDQPVLTFDSASDDQRDRYQKAVLYLTQDADRYNNRPVELRLEEPITNTTQWKSFSKGGYTIKRSFTTDFDF
jgi:hypothetical protein